MAGVDEYSRTAAQSVRDKLVLDHLWLVRHLVGKIVARLPPSVDRDNLESAGMLGLVEAADRFDPSRGVDFKAFSALRIRGAVLDELRRACPLPQAVLQNVMLVSRAKETMQPPVTVEALAEATGLDQDTVLDCLAAIPLTQMKSLEEIGDRWFCDHLDPPDVVAERADQKRIIADGVESLPRRERVVLTLYYLEDLRLKEIGQLLKLSESRISRLLTAAHLMLREYVRARYEE